MQNKLRGCKVDGMDSGSWVVIGFGVISVGSNTSNTKMVN